MHATQNEKIIVVDDDITDSPSLRETEKGLCTKVGKRQHFSLLA